MMLMNLNYLFNKKYYENFPQVQYNEWNKVIIFRKFQASSSKIDFASIESSFTLKTIYPGLLLGLGNTHEIGADLLDIDNPSETEKDRRKTQAEIKLGFTLDYVTGLPIIPGSTVKGVLRGAFSRHPDYIANILNLDEKVVKSSWKNIFEENPGKVIFFDAIPIKPGKDNRLFGIENITPHHEPLKNPIPLTLLKVIPNVEFLFRFGLNRWENSEITASDLLTVFKTILCDLGIGAKTNVGFGAMTDEGIKEQETYFFLESIYNTVKIEATQTARVSSPASGGVKPNLCRNIGCENPVAKRKDGTPLLYCSECIQKHNERKARQI